MILIGFSDFRVMVCSVRLVHGKESVRVLVKRSIKYLGLVLDSKLNYEIHFTQVTPRVEKAAISLGRLLPNFGGPREKVRRLYTAVTQSMLLYGSPIWAEDRKITPKNTKALRKVQRLMAIKVIKAYRTISAEAAITLAGMTPLDHLAGAYTEIYWG